MTFKPALLVQARQAQSLTQAGLSKASSMSQSKLSKIENGLLTPTNEDISALAASLRVTPDFLHWDDAVYGLGTASYFHRKQKSLRVSQLEKIQANVNLISMRLSRMLGNLDVTPTLQLPDLDPDVVGTPAEAARQLRAIWRTPMGPIDNVIRYAESAGTLVLREDFGTHRIDAISTWFPGRLPIMVVNESLCPERERFVIMHEIGHLTMHEGRPPRAEAEVEADAFAEEFLMPEREIRASLNGVNVESAVALKGYWKVQTQAVVLRARSLGLISAERSRSLFAYMNRLGLLKHEPAPLPRETIEFVSSLPRIHVGSLGYTTEELAKLLGMLSADVESRMGTKPRLQAVK